MLVMANYAKNDGPSQEPRRYICSRRNSNYVKIIGKSAFGDPGTQGTGYRGVGCE